MNKYRKKYQNVVERNNLLTVLSKDHNTIDSLESQALDAFYVEASNPEYFMQRMGQLYIKPIQKRRYNLNYYQSQAKILFPGTPRKIPTKAQILDSFVIKQKQRPRNLVQKPVYFDIIQKKDRPILIEQLDSFMCEKEKKIYHTIQSLNGLKIPAAGKFFNNNPTLRNMNIYELEYLKIKAPFKCSEPTSLMLPLKPKKVKFTDIESQNSSNLNYIINKLKIFTPADTSIRSISPLIIPRQPKKTSFKEIIPNKESDILYNIVPKIKPFNEVVIESIPDIFIPEQPKKRYYSAQNADNMSIFGETTPLFCLEIDPNEEIFIPNVYDMLLIQNYWDDLTVRSFRVCLRPPGYAGKSSRNLEYISNKNLIEMNENMKDEEESKQNNEDNAQDKDILKDFNLNHNNEIEKNKKEEIIDTNIYEDRNDEENKENKREEIVNQDNIGKNKKIKFNLKSILVGDKND